MTAYGLEAPAVAMTARVGARHHDVSDATRGVVARQLRVDAGPLDDWARIDAGDTLALALAAARQALGLASPAA